MAVAPVLHIALAAEDGFVEPRRLIHIVGDELVPIQPTVLVDDCRPEMLPRLPDPENGAGWVAGKRHPARRPHRGGREQDGAPRPLDPGRNRVGVDHGEVAGPCRHRSVLERPDPSRGETVAQGSVISAGAGVLLPVIPVE